MWTDRRAASSSRCRRPKTLVRRISTGGVVRSKPGKEGSWGDRGARGNGSAQVKPGAVVRVISLDNARPTDVTKRSQLQPANVLNRRHDVNRICRIRPCFRSRRLAKAIEKYTCNRRKRQAELGVRISLCFIAPADHACRSLILCSSCTGPRAHRC